MDIFNNNKKNLSPKMIETLNSAKDIDVELIPMLENLKWLDNIPKDQWVYIIPGLEDGSRPPVLLDHIYENAVIIIIENDPDRIKASLKNYDYTHVINSRRVVIIDTDNKNEIHVILSSIADRLNRSVYITTPKTNRDNEFRIKCIDIINKYTDMQMLLLATQMKNGPTTCDNLLQNARDYYECPGISQIKDVYQGHPAVVVSAGPSVDKQIELLKQHQNEIVIVSCLTMLKPLIENGINPDYVTALDYHPISAKFFEGLGDKHINRCEFILDPKVNNEVVKICKEYALSFIGNEWLDSVLNYSGDYMHNHHGSTVAHMSYSLAEHLGCDPILMIGQDLAFTDNKYYPECVLDCHEWKRENFTDIKNRPLIVEKDYQGNDIFTDDQMLTYREMFERIWNDSNATAIDCTEGGIEKINVEYMTFKDAINEYCHNVIAIPEMHPYIRENKSLEYGIAVDLRKGGIKFFIEQNDIAIQCIKDMEGRWGDDDHIRKVGATMKDVLNNVTSHEEVKQIIEFYSGIASMFRHRTGTEQVPEFSSSTQRREYHGKQDLIYYNKMKEAAEGLLELFKD
jgi:hypothetical protein